MSDFDINDFRAAIDPPPFSEYDAALPPYGSPLRDRLDVLSDAARYAVELFDAASLVAGGSVADDMLWCVKGHPVSVVGDDAGQCHVVRLRLSLVEGEGA